jgi:hypothetical protein
VTLQFLLSVLNLQAACLRRGILIEADFIGNESLVQRARNVLTARFLKAERCTHLLFVDADIEFHADTVMRLLEFDKDVVTAVYPKKMVDWSEVEAKLQDGGGRGNEPVHQMGLDFNLNLNTSEPVTVHKGFVNVLDSATGFMLIKRGILGRMAEHYRPELHCMNDVMGTAQQTPDYVALFDCMIDPVSRRYLSEDFAFCRRLQQMGGEIWADVASPLAHIGMNLHGADFARSMKLRRQRQQRQQQRVHSDVKKPVPST